MEAAQADGTLAAMKITGDVALAAGTPPANSGSAAPASGGAAAAVSKSGGRWAAAVALALLGGSAPSLLAGGGPALIAATGGLLASGAPAWAAGAARPATPAPAARSAAPAAVEDLATWQARADKAHKALVLAFGAKWCGPCQVFDRQVLPLPAVQRALASVVFVHYDADNPTGLTAARTLGVLGYPTFVALAQDGREIGRLQGYREAEEFSRWVAGAAADAEPTAVLQARAESDKAPAQALLQLGRRQLKSGDVAGAEALLGRAQKTAAGPIAAEVDWELRLIKLRRLLREEPRRSMVEHLERFSSGPSADAAFAALTRLGAADAPTRQALGRYIDAHADASQQDLLNNAVYSCLRVGALAEAERGARRLLALDGKNPGYLDTLAEVMHLRGDRDSALRYSREALAALERAGMTAKEQQQTRAALVRNQARFERGQRELPPELQVEEEVLQPWEK